VSANENQGFAEKPAVEIYTDGGCEPNPGPGGYGVVLLHPRKRMEISGGFRLTTNNRMEILAAIKGLELLKVPCMVRLYSDSEYVVNAITKGWAAGWKKRNWWRKTARVPNADLWQKLLPLCEGHEVEFLWVRGHIGVKENERCDELADAALRQPDLPADEGYENRPVDVRPPIKEEGEPCWKCDEPVIKRPGRVKAKREYYFDYYFYCPKCHATYQVEEARREMEKPPTLF